MRLLGFVVLGFLLTPALGGCRTDSDAPSGNDWTLDSGALKMRVTESPWNMTFVDARGAPVLVELPELGDGPSGSLGMHLGPPPPGNGQESTLPPLDDGQPAVPPLRDSGWVHAVAVESYAYEGESYVATLATSDPGGKLELVATPESDGVVEVTVRPSSADGV